MTRFLFSSVGDGVNRSRRRCFFYFLRVNGNFSRETGSRPAPEPRRPESPPPPGRIECIRRTRRVPAAYIMVRWSGSGGGKGGKKKADTERADTSRPRVSFVKHSVGPRAVCRPFDATRDARQVACAIPPFAVYTQRRCTGPRGAPWHALVRRRRLESGEIKVPFLLTCRQRPPPPPGKARASTPGRRRLWMKNK